VSLRKRILWFNLFCLLGFSSVSLVSCCASKVPALPSVVVDHKFPYEAFVHIKVVPKDNGLSKQMKPGEYEKLKSYFMAMGSGAVIENDGSSEIITAGHVCDSSDMVFPASPFTEFEVFVYDWQGNGWKAEVAAIDKENDLCLLTVAGVEYPAELQVATKSPNIGDHLFLAAAPLGVFVKEMPLLFDGYYSGEDEGGTIMSTIPVAPGSSGGAIVNKNGEIVGIVTAGLVGFENVGIATSWKKLQEFLLHAREEE
jgi:S1-C subfamily serine protease